MVASRDTPHISAANQFPLTFAACLFRDSAAGLPGRSRMAGPFCETNSSQRVRNFSSDSFCEVLCWSAGMVVILTS